MKSIEKVAHYMHHNGLKLVTAESCTAGLISSLLADIPGAGELLDCAFVVYSVEAKKRCLQVSAATLANNNLTSEAVAREMALGAARKSDANVAVANTGVADAAGDGTPPGTQCYAWVFKRGGADGKPTVFSTTEKFSGSRSEIRNASAIFALEGIVRFHHDFLAADHYPRK